MKGIHQNLVILRVSQHLHLVFKGRHIQESRTEAQTSLWQWWARLPLARLWRGAGVAASARELAGIGLRVDHGPLPPGYRWKSLYKAPGLLSILFVELIP